MFADWSGHPSKTCIVECAQARCGCWYDVYNQYWSIHNLRNTLQGQSWRSNFPPIHFSTWCFSYNWFWNIIFLCFNFLQFSFKFDIVLFGVRLLSNYCSTYILANMFFYLDKVYLEPILYETLRNRPGVGIYF